MKITLTIYFSFLILLSSGQGNFSKTVTKEDGRFISNRIDASEFSVSSLDRTGLVKEIHINIELWTLLKEPIEKYLFRWKRGSSVTSSDYTVLSKSSLAKYPDLLKRYNNLKPTNVELKYFVSTQLYPKYVSVKNLDVCGKKFINNLQVTKNASWGSNEGASGYRKINSRAHFIIISDGKTGNDLVSGSPKDWLNFIQWDDCNNNSNQKALNTFKYANQMTFYGLEVTKLEIPLREIDAIAKEYNEREKEEVEEEKSDTDESEIEDFLTEETTTSDDNFLTENENISDITDDSFLTESDDEDFLSSGNQEDFLVGTSSNKISYKIDYKGSMQGVIDEKTGKVLIPYRNWQIKEFTDGLAKVSIQIDRFECSGIVTAYKVGYVDITGEFLDGYDIDFSYYGEFVQPVYIKINRLDKYGNPIKQSESSKRKAREKKERDKRERERCNRETDNWKSQIINQYK
ncbi:MAG: hypothetical protein QM503_01450 [Bacteroidota bacterium]